MCFCFVTCDHPLVVYGKTAAAAARSSSCCRRRRLLQQQLLLLLLLPPPLLLLLTIFDFRNTRPPSSNSIPLKQLHASQTLKPKP